MSEPRALINQARFFFSFPTYLTRRPQLIHVWPTWRTKNTHQISWPCHPSKWDPHLLHGLDCTLGIGISLCLPWTTHQVEVVELCTLKAALCLLSLACNQGQRPIAIWFLHTPWQIKILYMLPKQCFMVHQTPLLWSLKQPASIIQLRDQAHMQGMAANVHLNQKAGFWEAPSAVGLLGRNVPNIVSWVLRNTYL